MEDIQMDWLSKREKKIFLTVFLLVGLFVQWYGVNANSRLDLTRSMVDHGQFSIDPMHENTGDRSYYEGRYYSDKEPGMAFLATPIYASWKGVYSLFGDAYIDDEPREKMFSSNNVTISYPSEPGSFYLSSLILVTLLTSTVSLSILSVLIYRLSGDVLESEAKRLVVTFGFAFGTLLTHYGAMFMPNAVVTLFSFSSFYLIYRWESAPSFRKMVFAGFLGGFSVVVDPTGAPVLVATFFYALHKYDGVPYSYFLGGFLGGLPMMLYNTAIFGYPWMLPRFFLDPQLYPQLQQSAKAIPVLTEQGFRLGLERLSFVSARLLFYPYRGIFYWFPLLVVGLFGLKDIYRKEKDLMATIGLITAILMAVVGGWWAWWMGGFFGARYLSVLIPFLMLPVFHGAKKLDTRLLAVIAGLSILVNLAGFQGYYEDQLKDLDNSSEMKPKYQEKVRTIQPLANPVKNYYLPGFLEKGAQSRIINGLYRGNLPPDIRVYATDGRAPPLLLYWILAAIPALIWRREIAEKASKHRNRVMKELDE